jgi:hypothetical protein
MGWTLSGDENFKVGLLTFVEKFGILLHCTYRITLCHEPFAGVFSFPWLGLWGSRHGLWLFQTCYYPLRQGGSRAETSGRPSWISARQMVAASSLALLTGSFPRELSIPRAVLRSLSVRHVKGLVLFALDLSPV